MKLFNKEIWKNTQIVNKQPYIILQDALNKFYKEHPTEGLGQKNKYWLNKQDEKIKKANKELSEEMKKLHQERINELLGKFMQEHLDYIKEHYGE